MAESIIIGINYATRVRTVLGVTDVDLTDAEIDEKLAPVEYSIADIITNYTILTGKDKVYLETGTVAALAAEMCPVLKTKMPKSEKGLNTSVESGENWDAKQYKLLAEKDKWLSKISGYTSLYSDMPLFSVAGPTRAGITGV